MPETDFLLKPLQKTPSELRKWVEARFPEIGNAFDLKRNGHLSDWREALEQIPSPTHPAPRLDQATVSDGTDEVLAPAPWRAFHPWRKGPYRFGDLNIDTEWRSDWKWDRLAKALGSLEGLRCLDIGCGNGYHLWRMRGAGAALALGLDPYLLYVMQFLAVAKRIPDQPVTVLPLGWECLPDMPPTFDRVFSMGVLYHCNHPAAHLQALAHPLVSNGTLILETLTVPDEFGPLLTFEGRYAQMRNVHPLPTVATLTGWLETAGYQDIRHIDTTPTTVEEQRSTDWMTFHSLADFLDPEDPAKTVEGHPAPRRSLMMAQAPRP
jgi:tRNA (mo5U34)-methyltransferase